MEIEKLIEYAKYGEITAFVGSLSLTGNKTLPNFKNESNVLDHFINICEKEKLVKALSILEVKEEVLSFSVTELSNSLKNKLAIIESLVSKENVFVFDNIQKSLSYREIQNVKRVLKKLAEHNKKVIVVTNDIEFLFGLTKNVLVIDRDKFVDLTPIDWFDQNIYQYVTKPPIIEFVMNCKQRGIKIDNCYETKELLKAIYRSVDK